MIKQVCAKCSKSIYDILLPCPHCGYQHPLTKTGLELQKKVYPNVNWKIIVEAKESQEKTTWFAQFLVICVQEREFVKTSTILMNTVSKKYLMQKTQNDRMVVKWYQQ